MSSYDIGTVQKALLKLMKDVHKLCEENHLTYYIAYGTCLGAKRHQGFIPWDDDVDIYMPREDYEKLCAMDTEQFPSHMELRFYKTDAASPMHYAKIIDNTTTIIEKEYCDYVEGLYIDIFPLDGVSSVKAVRQLQAGCTQLLLRMIINNRITTGRPERIAKRIFRAVSKKCRLSTLHKTAYKLACKKQYAGSKYIASLFGDFGEFYSKEVFGQPTLYKFEDTQLYGPVDVDRYLTTVYGDYMQLPPEEERVAKHAYLYIDLNQPYKEYLAEHPQGN